VLGQELPRITTVPPGPRSRELAGRLAAVESPAVGARREAREAASGAAQEPIVYARASGANVEDVDGNVYVDLAAGFGALLLGHRPPAVATALDAQLDRLWLALGDVYASDVKVTLVERLAAMFPERGARVLLGTSGADAVTAALKTAMLATGRPGVVAFRGAYHGLSYGPLAACGYSEGFRAPFAEQLGVPVTFAPYPGRPEEMGACASAVRDALAAAPIGAVLVEPILGRGGCVVPPADLLATLRDLCDRSGALLVADEIWTGLGRAGAPLASAAAGVVPDVVCLGKGLAGGLPLSACIGRGRVMAAWGEHGGSAIHTATHFGAPLACAAALALLEEIEAKALSRRASETGERWRRTLEERVAARGVREVRGRGMMVGVELAGGAARALAVSRALLRRGYIVVTGGTGGDVLTLTPPIDISERLLEGFVDALDLVLAEPSA
jgi:4-aminobutyrate aminotransferase / (S)-3-amino-2-methylpropionate transaminase / 5-aminovalerate transaminase